MWLAITPVPSTRADYAVSILQDSVAVDITGDFVQGLPVSAVNSTSGFAAIPAFRWSLEGGNASQLMAALTSGIKAEFSSAGVNQVRFTANSNSSLMHYELSFNVANVFKTTGDTETVDLSWRAFTMEDDFGANSISVNNIVPNYLQSGIVLQAESTGGPAGIQQVKTWYLNSHVVLPIEVPAQTQALKLFNFTSLAQPLQTWTSTRDLSNMRLLLQSESGFNITFIDRVTEAEITTTYALNAINKVRATIDAPLPTRITDNQLVFEAAGASWRPQLMLTAVAAGIVLFLGSLVAERRIQHQTRPRQGRKSKR